MDVSPARRRRPSRAKRTPRTAPLPLSVQARREPPCTFGASALARMVADPGRECRLVDVAGSDRQHGERGVRLRAYQSVAVQREKQTDRQERRALVAIDEGMVLGEPNGIARCEICNIRFPVSSEVTGPGERGFEQPFVAKAAASTVLGKALVMEQAKRLPIDPAPPHLASW